jgi:hypothetical protein
MSPRRIVVPCLAAAAVGLLLLFIGLLVDAERAWFSYLNAWTYGVTICVGALILLMTGHAAKASWMVVTRRFTEAIVDALPLYLLLFVPICFGLRYLYPWASPSAVTDPALRHAIEHKRAYLNQPFFVVRSFFYLAVFVVIGSLLRTWSKACDERPDVRLVHRMRALSGGGLPIVALVLTWASFDWTMSLEPEWSSTIFGLYTFAGGFVGAISLVSVMVNVSRLRPTAPPVTGDHAQALGRLLFAMIIFWAYMAFSQLLIYWIGDIPEEVSYYRLRASGTWRAATFLLVLGHFAGPFFALLNRRWKRDFAYLASVGWWMLLMHFVDVYWMVMPVLDRSGIRPHWLDLGAILFVGGLSCAWIVRRYTSAAPMPLHVPDLAQGIHYEAAV